MRGCERTEGRNGRLRKKTHINTLRCLMRSTVECCECGHRAEKRVQRRAERRPHGTAKWRRQH